MFVKQNSAALWLLRRRQRSFIVVVVFLALIYCSDITKIFAGGTSAKELFTDVTYKDKDDLGARLKKEEQDPTIVRGRYVRVKFDCLVGKDIPHGADAIKLNLFYDVPIQWLRNAWKRDLRSGTRGLVTLKTLNTAR